MIELLSSSRTSLGSTRANSLEIDLSVPCPQEMPPKSFDYGSQYYLDLPEVIGSRDDEDYG